MLIVLLIPIITFTLQIVACLFYQKKAQTQQTSKLADTVVLIPAHNESVNLLPTLQSIRQQSVQSLRVLVVADNCEDDTAAVAREAGVEVIERFNQSLRGKGYALDFGIQYLKHHQPPAIVVILDADCLLHEGALVNLIDTAMRTSRPTQALYLMHAKPDAPIKTKIAEFAWTVKNWVRPQGLHVLGLPCQLMGSGMAFPWPVISQVELATGHIVEDMKLGIDLANNGHAPLFCPQAVVYSEFPSNETGLKTQRTRWEHGHIGMLLQAGPQLLREGLLQLNVALLAMALDLLVPPLALLVMLTGLVFAVGLLAALVSGDLYPWALPTLHLMLLSMAVLLAWVSYGRQIIQFKDLMMIPAYMVAKVPVYLRFLFKRQAEWVRSKRD